MTDRKKTFTISKTDEKLKYKTYVEHLHINMKNTPSTEGAVVFSKIPPLQDGALPPLVQPGSDALPKIKPLPKGILHPMTGPGGDIKVLPP